MSCVSKEASLRSTVSALKADCEAVKNEISEIRDETKATSRGKKANGAGNRNEKASDCQSSKCAENHNIAIERCFKHFAMGRRNWGARLAVMGPLKI